MLKEVCPAVATKVIFLGATKLALSTHFGKLVPSVCKIYPGVPIPKVANTVLKVPLAVSPIANVLLAFNCKIALSLSLLKLIDGFVPLAIKDKLAFLLELPVFLNCKVGIDVESIYKDVKAPLLKVPPVNGKCAVELYALLPKLIQVGSPEPLDFNTCPEAPTVVGA
jgi:hypothetical protein